MELLDLPAPSVIEEIDFETIKQRKLDRLLEIMHTKGIRYTPSESDDLMTAIEADAYEEMLLRTRINIAIKEQLLAFSTGANLDHLAATRYGVTRLGGARPYALARFTLSLAQGSDIVIPEGLILSGEQGEKAFLAEEVVIPSGTLSAEGRLELDAFVEKSDAVCETILTPLPWVIACEQLDPFTNGSDAEEDERFRERIWYSRERKSTAGSLYMYVYYAKSADVRIDKVQVLFESPGVVGVYLLGREGEADSAMINRVKETLNAQEIRPLTDHVTVQSAEIIDITIKATLVLYDRSYEEEVLSLIDDTVRENTMTFGKSLSLAKIIGLLESSQVQDVILQTPESGVTCAAHQVIRATLDLSVSEAA